MEIRLMDLLNEISTSTYKYNCAMLYFDFPEMGKIHSQIDKKDIYTEEGDISFGLEDEPHTTLLYGLHQEVGVDKIKSILEKFVYGDCTLHNISIFENDRYDVLKFDVKGKNLYETNNELKKYPFTSDYPDYHPHLTIGYLKPGTGKKYVNLMEGKEYSLIPTHSIYSLADGGKEKLMIRVK